MNKILKFRFYLKKLFILTFKKISLHKARFLNKRYINKINKKIEIFKQCIFQILTIIKKTDIINTTNKVYKTANSGTI